MLTILTILIMLGVAYVYLGEGLFTSFAMCCGILGAGLIAFNFWEPMADALGSKVSGTFLAGFEDALSMVFLFAVSLGVFRIIVNNLSPFQIEYHPLLQSIGGACFGLVSGYLVTGFLLCVLQTLPWKQDFLGFSVPTEADAGSLRSMLPPDEVWLALMHRAGAFAFADSEDPKARDAESVYERYQTFDKYGNFELRYKRYRRYNEQSTRAHYSGEFDNELGRPAPTGPRDRRGAR